MAIQSAFWQCLIHSDDWHKTAFAVEGIGLFEFVRRKISFAYIYDVFVYSKDPEQHLRDFRTMLTS